MSSIKTRIQLATTELFIPKFLKLDTTVSTENGDINEAIKEIDFSELNLTENDDVLYARVRHEEQGLFLNTTDWSDTRAIHRTEVLDKYVAGMCLSNYMGINDIPIWQRCDARGNLIEEIDFHFDSHWIFRDNFQTVVLKDKLKGEVVKVDNSKISPDELASLSTLNESIFDHLHEEYIRFKPLYYAIYPGGIPGTTSEGKYTIFLSAAPVIVSGTIDITTPVPAFHHHSCIDTTNTYTSQTTNKLSPLLIGKYPASTITLIDKVDDNNSEICTKLVSIFTPTNDNTTDTFFSSNPTLPRELIRGKSKYTSLITDSPIKPEDFTGITDSDTKRLFTANEMFLLQLLYLFTLGSHMGKDPDEIIYSTNPDGTTNQEQRWKSITKEDITKSMFGLVIDWRIPTIIASYTFNSLFDTSELDDNNVIISSSRSENSSYLYDLVNISTYYRPNLSLTNSKELYTSTVAPGFIPGSIKVDKNTNILLGKSNLVQYIRSMDPSKRLLGGEKRLVGNWQTRYPGHSEVSTLNTLQPMKVFGLYIGDLSDIIDTYNPFDLVFVVGTLNYTCVTRRVLFEYTPSEFVTPGMNEYYIKPIIENNRDQITIVSRKKFLAK